MVKRLLVAYLAAVVLVAGFAAVVTVLRAAARNAPCIPPEAARFVG